MQERTVSPQTERGSRVKRLRRLSLFLGQIAAIMMLLSSFGAVSLSTVAGALPTGSTSCPSSKNAVYNYSVVITRNGQTISAPNLTGVRSGDHVKVNFDIDDRCTSVPLTLVSYKAAQSTYSDATVGQRTVYS